LGNEARSLDIIADCIADLRARLGDVVASGRNGMPSKEPPATDCSDNGFEGSDRGTATAHDVAALADCFHAISIAVTVAGRDARGRRAV
jgi:hypothetical protein